MAGPLKDSWWHRKGLLCASRLPGRNLIAHFSGHWVRFIPSGSTDSPFGVFGVKSCLLWIFQ